MDVILNKYVSKDHMAALLCPKQSPFDVFTQFRLVLPPNASWYRLLWHRLTGVQQSSGKNGARPLINNSRAGTPAVEREARM